MGYKQRNKQADPKPLPGSDLYRDPKATGKKRSGGRNKPINGPRTKRVEVDQAGKKAALKGKGREQAAKPTKGKGKQVQKNEDDYEGSDSDEDSEDEDAVIPDVSYSVGGR